jgi:hypothetical protein
MIIEIILALLLLLYIYFNIKTEGFSDLYEKKIIKQNMESLDKLHSSIYDEMYDTTEYHKLTGESIIPYLNSNSQVLCVGTRTGHILQLLSQSTSLTGIENSSYFIDKTTDKYGAFNIVNGNYNNIKLFEHNKFTHIVIPIFIMHTYQNMDYFFDIMYNWLVHNGYVFITYFSKWDNITDVVNGNPNDEFIDTYDFSVEITPKPKGIIYNEIIKKNKILKRKYIWEFSNIDIDKLIHISAMKGFKFIENIKLKNDFYMCILRKNN